MLAEDPHTVDPGEDQGHQIVRTVVGGNAAFKERESMAIAYRLRPVIGCANHHQRRSRRGALK